MAMPLPSAPSGSACAADRRRRGARRLAVAVACAALLAGATAARSACDPGSACAASIEASLAATRASVRGPYREDALDEARATLALAARGRPGSVEHARALLLVVEALDARGETHAAETELARAEALVQAAPVDARARDDLLGTVAMRRGGILLDRRELDAAIAAYEEALVRLQRADPQGRGVVSARNNLGLVYRHARDFERAREHFAAALALKQSRGYEAASVLNTQLNVASLEIALGNPGTATPLIDAGIRLAAAEVPDSALHGRWLLLRALALELAGEPGPASTAAEAALTILRGRLPDSLPVALAEATLARTLLVLERPDAARAAYERALASLDGQLERLGGDALARAEFRAGQVEIHRGHIDLLLAQGEVDAALRAHARYRAGVLSWAPLARDALPDYLDALAPGEWLLAYLTGEQRSWVIVARGGDRARARAWPLPVALAALEDSTQRLLVLLADPRAPPAARAALDALLAELGAALLREPLAAAAPGDAVAIVADGPLHRVPFAALDAADAACAAPCPLARRVELREIGPELPSPAAARGTEVYAFADPVPPQADTTYRVPLPGARREAEAIAGLYGTRATLRVGAAASETRLVEDAGRAGVLHLATHAVADARDPLASYVVLSGSERDDGVLSAIEIAARLRMAGALVTLSACDSAGGRVIGGEGMVGLVHAFRRAGAAQVIAARWRVDDAGTAALMQAFYRRLHAGASAPAALRAAQMDLLDARPGAVEELTAAWRGEPAIELSHPFYWAAFSLHGAR